jgi:Tol biopolymer transport system component
MPKAAIRVIIALCAALAPPAAFAQGFGQNKVQYQPFEWTRVQTEHFDIYFSQGGAQIGTFAARHIEKMYAEVSAMTGHKLTERVPVILHNTHTEFQQTNVIPMALPEGVGGFTERFKNRVVLPFEGSYRDFYHVLQHELSHAVVFNMLFGGEGGGPVARQYDGFPLWVNEGLAEYNAIGWDLGSEFFMIDATTFGYVAPPIMDFGGFLAYKGGQLFFHFLESVYGKGTTTRFIQNLAASGDMLEAFKKATNTSLEEAGEIWLRELRYLYWPELGRREYGKSTARRLTHRGKDRSFYNLQPSLSPDGTEIAFFSDRESWEAVYILNVKTEKVTRTVIQSGDQGEHESFRSFKSGITWSPDGKSIAVVSKQGGRDVIHIVNAKNGRVLRVLRPDVQGVLSPNWSRDGKRIAFSGQLNGFADIYVYELGADSARRLTHDIAHDDKPVFSPSGKWIVFESDRPRAHFGGGGDPLAGFDSLLAFKDLYRISAEGDSLSLVAGGRWDEKMPSFGPSDSQLVFVSNRSGLDNIYLWREGGDGAGGAAVRPITNLLTGCFTPSWSRDGKRLAFSLFEAGGWDVYLMNDPLAKVRADSLPRTRFIRHAEDSAAGFFRPPIWENLTSFKADSVDSARRAAEKKPKKKSRKELKAARADSLKAAARADSLRIDSLKVKAAAPDTGKAADSSARAAADTSRSRTQAQPNTGPPIPRPGSVIDTARKDSVAADSTARKKRRAKSRRSPFLTDSSAYLDANGDFIEREYETKWSFDAVSASVGVDNYYGTGGLAYLTLSDLMGDQRISFAFSINGSLANTNGYVEYAYLPHRADFVASAFQESQEWRYETYWGAPNAAYANRSSGFGLGLRYPFSPFTRVEAGVFNRFSRRSSEEVWSYDSLGYPDSILIQRTVTNAFLPSAAWVNDNAQWGIVGPVAGRRLMAGVQYLPPVYQDDFSYVKTDVDARFYKELFKRYTLALRVSGGFSEAVGGYGNPHSYFVGGESYTFNAHANYDNLPTPVEFYFSELDFPLRGFDLFDFRGNRKFITNGEFRFPFVNELSFAWPVPFSITNVMGSIFADYGGAWSGNEPRLGLGMGYGWRLNLGVFILKYSRAWPMQGPENTQKGARSYWSLGSEF